MNIKRNYSFCLKENTASPLRSPGWLMLFD